MNLILTRIPRIENSHYALASALVHILFDKTLTPNLCLVHFITFLTIYKGKFCFGQFYKKNWDWVRPSPPIWDKIPKLAGKKLWLPLNPKAQKLNFMETGDNGDELGENETTWRVDFSSGPHQCIPSSLLFAKL